MQFDFTPKSGLLLIFFVHGLVFCFLLLKKGWQYQDKASLWLSLFVFLCAMYIAPFMLGYAGWYSDEPRRNIMFYVPFQQLLLIGPVIYFYTQNLLNKSFKISKKDVLHFLPALAYFVYTLIVFVTDKIILHQYYFYADGQDKDLDPWYQVAGLVSMLVYLYLSLRYYALYKRIAFEVVSFADSILFNWIQRYLLALLLISALRVLFFILNPEWGEFGSKFWYYLCFSILFYYITISGYANSVQSVIAVEAALSDQEAPVQAQEKEIKETTELVNLPEWKDKIVQIMHAERLFENPNLTLTDVAEKLKTNPKQVSQIV
ncbi:MAG TPA: AraC family transcriptional regulator, partial [Haliscomenobacter sp.]|nr:AraC family transcriptional regulator [Haliscomenobacter sp.]